MNKIKMRSSRVLEKIRAGGVAVSIKINLDSDVTCLGTKFNQIRSSLI